MENSTVSAIRQLTTVVVNATTKHDANIFFTWYDYMLCLFLLSVSLSIGVYFGCCGKKLRSTKDYLMGGNEMKVIPVSISLIARLVNLNKILLAFIGIEGKQQIVRSRLWWVTRWQIGCALISLAALPNDSLRVDRYYISGTNCRSLTENYY